MRNSTRSRATSRRQLVNLVEVKRRFAIEAPVAVVLLAVLAILGGIGFLAYKSLNQIVTSVREEAEPDMRLLRTKEVLADLEDARNSVNAYNITDDTAQLEPYFAAISSVDQKIYELRSLPGHDSTSRVLVDTLEELIGRKFEVLSRMLVLQDDQWVDQALYDLAMSIRPEKRERVVERPVEVIAEEPKTEKSSDQKKEVAATPSSPQPEEKGIKKILKRVFGPKTVEEPAGDVAEEPASEEPVAEEEKPVKRSHRTVTETEIYTIYPDVRSQIATMRAEEEARLSERREKELALNARLTMLSDSIGVVVASFEDNQRQALAAKTTAADALATRTTRLITAFGLAAGLLLIIAFWGITVSLRRSRAYNQVMAEARARAEMLARSKEQFLANMSHELRTPLHAISGFSESLLSEKLGQRQREKVETIYKAADHLANIINDILDLSKLDAGKLKLEPEPTDIRKLLNEVSAWLEPSAQAKGIELNVICEDSVPTLIEADPMRLKQVLLNIAGNAVKFTNEGEVTLYVSAAADRFRVDVRDTGIGIPSDKIETIFHAFSQADASISKKYEGTGLGLAITRKLVQLMAGTISVESRLGEGSTFSVDVPMKAADESGVTLDPDEHYDLSGLSVLAVDDEAFNRQLLEAMLDNEVRHLTVVSLGSDVLKSLETRTYDVLLLDLRMPGMSGVEVAQALDGSHPDLKVLALTAVTQKDELDAALRAGVSHFLAKPFNKRALVRKIAELVGQAPTQEAHSEEPVRIDDLLEVGNGDPAFVREMIELFIRTTREGIEEMEAACDERDWQRVRNIAHRLAPPCGFMKADDLYDILKRIEERAESPNPASAAELLPLAARETSGVLSRLDEVLKQPA